MRVLLTRPRKEAERFARELAAEGHEAVFSPVLSIRDLAAEIPGGDFDVVIATSAHAFEVVDRRPSARGLKGRPVGVVGVRTARAARGAGFEDVRHVCANAEHLAAALADAYPSGARILYLAGRDRKAALESLLGKGGFALTAVEVYEARAEDALERGAVEAIRAGRIDSVAHFSRRSAALFCALAAAAGVEIEARALVHVCLSADVAEGLRSLEPRRIAIAKEPKSRALVEALRQAGEAPVGQSARPADK